MRISSLVRACPVSFVGAFVVPIGLGLASGCSRSAPPPTSSAPVASSDPRAEPSSSVASARSVASSTPSAPSEPASSGAPATDFTRGCPIDPAPERNAKDYGHGVGRFVTPDRKTHDFQLEIARTDAAQERGLMYRTSLAADAGMVFDFADIHHAIFWMRNTCVPLDIVFIDEERRVIGVVTAARLTDDPREVPGWSRYVVELGAGVAKAHGIALGTRFEPPSP